MAYTTLSAVMTAIAADAGLNSATAPQSAFTAIGALEAGRKEGPPRVVWTPGGGDIEPPDQQESAYSRIGYTRRIECTVTFLGASYDAAETLLYHWLAACQRTQGNNCVTPKSEQYRDETLTGTNRHAISIICDVLLPVPYETYTAAEVNAATHTGSITNPA